mgnify:CR=1 FL=1
MKKLFKVIAVILIIATLGVLAISLTACKKDNDVVEKDKLVVATNAEFAPFEALDGENFVGIDIDIAKIFAEKLGLELEIKNMEFDSVVTSIGKNGIDIGMAGLSVSEQRAKVVDFTDNYYTASQMIIVKSDNTEYDACENAEEVEAIFKTKNKDSYKAGYQTGTVSDLYIGGDEDWEFDGFENNIEGKGYQNAGLAVQDLIAGKIDIVVVDNAPGKLLVDAVANKGKVKLIEIPLYEDEYAFAVDKAQPMLKYALNGIIAEMKANGKLDEIIAKHFNPEA